MLFISNFHLPYSTLLMMVAAFGGYDLVMKAYDLAVKEKYRFGYLRRCDVDYLDIFPRKGWHRTGYGFEDVFLNL